MSHWTDTGSAPASHPALVRAVPAAALALVAFAVWIGTGLGGESVVRYVDDLATAGVAVVTAAACSLAARRHTGRLALFWWLLAAATAAWSLGEILWARSDLILEHGAPVVSYADVGYLGGVPLAAAALLVHPALRGRGTGTARALLDALVLATALFLLSWTLLIGPLWNASNLRTLAGLVTLAYPVGDVVLLLLILLVVRGTSNRDRLDLWLLLAGLAVMTCSDTLYGYLVQVKLYSTGNLIDIGWFAGYLAIALGARASRPARAAEPVPCATTPSPAGAVVPFLPMLAALGFAGVCIQLGHRLDRLGLATATALILLVLGRQALVALDLRSERESEAMAERILAAVDQGPGSRR